MSRLLKLWRAAPPGATASLPATEAPNARFSPDRLAGYVSHEFRTPLMVIKSALHCLRREATSSEAFEALADINQEVARLNDRVDQTLELIRLVRFDYAQTDLNALCAACVGRFDAGLEGMPVVLSLDSSLPPVVTDPTRLQMAMTNVLMSARQSARAREHAGAAASERTAIALCTRQLPDDRIAIVMTDEGTFISEWDVRQAFEDHFNRKQPGYGLGLALAKYIVTGLEGTVSVESDAERGTRVRIELPGQPSLAAMTKGLWPECAECVTLGDCMTRARQPGATRE